MLARLTALLALGAAPASHQDLTPPFEQVGEHDAAIALVDVDPDGEVLVTAVGPTVRAWDARERELLWEASLEHPVRALDVTEDLVYATYGIANARPWKLRSGEPLDGPLYQAPKIDAIASSFAADPKDRWLWMAVEGGLLRANQRAQDGASVPLEPTAIAMDPKGKALAVGTADGLVLLVDPKRGRLDDRSEMKGHEGAVTALAFAGPKRLVSGGADGTVRIWKVSRARELHVLREHHDQPVVAVACDGKGKTAATADRSGTIVLWDVDDGERLATLGTDTATVGLAFCDDVDGLASTAGDQLLLWDLNRFR